MNVSTLLSTVLQILLIQAHISMCMQQNTPDTLVIKQLPSGIILCSKAENPNNSRCTFFPKTYTPNEHTPCQQFTHNNQPSHNCFVYNTQESQQWINAIESEGKAILHTVMNKITPIVDPTTTQTTIKIALVKKHLKE